MLEVKQTITIYEIDYIATKPVRPILRVESCSDRALVALQVAEDAPRVVVNAEELSQAIKNATTGAL